MTVDIFEVAYKVVQDIVLALAIMMILVEGMWMRRNRDKWMYGVGVCFLGLHLIVFYVNVIIARDGIPLSWISFRGDELQQFFTYWSSIVRAQELITLTFLSGLRLLSTYKRT